MSIKILTILSFVMISTALLLNISPIPACAGTNHYIAAREGNIAALNMKDGRILWKRKISSFSGLQVSRDKVFISNEKGTVWAFDRTSGAILWKQPALANHGITAPALIGSSSLIVGDMQGYLHFLSQKDGHFVARVKLKTGGIIASPIVDGRNIYVYGNNGRLVKLAVL